jgi:uncharacterized membrane protein YuzA (DUF378 family)
MGHLRQSTMREVRDPAFALLLASIAVSLIKATEQPGVTITRGDTSARLVPGDLLLALLAVVIAVRIFRNRSYPRPAIAVTATAAALASLVLITAFANSGTALVTAGKLIMLAVLLVASVVLIDTVDRLWVVVLLIVIVTTSAVAWGLVGFVRHPGDRQASFLGEHDLAALSTASLVVGLAALHCRHRLSRLPLVAGIVGCVGIVLGAALASLLGLYLAGAALVGIAALRRSLRLRSVVITVLVALVLTGATLSLRSGSLGFLHQWFAPAENAKPGQYAGSWSQRLIFVYVGGRVFLANPLFGTGWWGELPPSEYARFLPDARARFPDQPPRYFPPDDGSFIPQQTFDQVAYELGVVGIALLLALVATASRDSLRTARRWPRGEPDELAAYLAAPWLASLLGVIAGSALFGGSPIAALFWLTFGLVAASSVLATAIGQPHDLGSA